MNFTPTKVERFVSEDGQEFHTEAEAERQNRFLEMLPHLYSIMGDPSSVNASSRRKEDSSLMRRCLLELFKVYEFTEIVQPAGPDLFSESGLLRRGQA